MTCRAYNNFHSDCLFISQPFSVRRDCLVCIPSGEKKGISQTTNDWTHESNPFLCKNESSLAFLPSPTYSFRELPCPSLISLATSSLMTTITPSVPSPKPDLPSELPFLPLICSDSVNPNLFPLNVDLIEVAFIPFGDGIGPEHVRRHRRCAGSVEGPYHRQ